VPQGGSVCSEDILVGSWRTRAELIGWILAHLDL
jgi:hypothetical protein